MIHLVVVSAWKEGMNVRSNGGIFTRFKQKSMLAESMLLVLYNSQRFLLECLHFVFEPLHFVFELLHFVLESWQFVLKSLHFVLKSLHFVELC